MAPAHVGMTPKQLATYQTQGVVRLPGAVPPADAGALAEVVWRRLRTGHGIVRDRPETWIVPRPAQLAAKTDELAAMGSPAVRAVLDQLLGVEGWLAPERWGLPLVTLPGFARRWDVPHKGWHLDIPATAEPPRVARVFVLLGRLSAGGGGTGYIAGSHKVLQALAQDTGRALKSGDARALLTVREAWFAALFAKPQGEDREARFVRQRGVARGVPVQVGEMTGEPGDVYVMHPLVLHAVMPSARPEPRLMLTEWVYGR